MRSWLFEVSPVILTVYDVKGNAAYWLDVQNHARALDPDETLARRTVTLRIPLANVWTPAVVRQLRLLKNRLVSRQERRYFDGD